MIGETVNYDAPENAVFDHSPNYKDVMAAEEASSFVPLLPGKERCDSGCKGWALFEKDFNGPLIVCKCDECDLLEYDDDAVPLARAAGIACTDSYPFFVTGLLQKG